MTRPILKVDKLCKYFGGLRAVHEVSFDVVEGSILGIAGPNGSGKSTLFNAITSIPFTPTSGSIEFDGQSIDSFPAHKIARAGLCRTFQKDAEFQDLSPLDTMLLSVSYAGQKERPERATAIEAALDLVKFEPSRWDMPTRDLSVYEKKQLMIGSALVSKPKMLLLDEPASGLTKPEIAALDALLLDVNKSGVTIILIEHVLSLLLSVSQSLLVLNQGQVLTQGEPDAVVRDPLVIDAYLGGRG
ncbi:ATP-binding cassette domain-containing protein [Pacificibacter sp. AS14]|uniref:ABC transporter ATP-binding protein n=1 Tax=Alphaproteobacteria TaxID=28211 RepID=UPI003173E8C0